MPNSKIKKTKNPQNKIDINHIAKLANLKLTKEEKSKFSQQLPDILSYIEKLSKVDTKNLAPLAHAAGLKNVWRDDETIPSLNPQDAPANTKQTYHGFFKVKKIFDDASALAQHHSESTEE